MNLCTVRKNELRRLLRDRITSDDVTGTEISSFVSIYNYLQSMESGGWCPQGATFALVYPAETGLEDDIQ